MEFVKVNIDTSLVPYNKNGRAKILFPHGSELEGFAVWLSEKLLKWDCCEYLFCAPETFSFQATKQRYEESSKSWKIVEERTLTARELANVLMACGGEDMRIRVVEIIPEAISPIDNPQACEELMR